MPGPAIKRRRVRAPVAAKVKDMASERPSFLDSQHTFPEGRGSAYSHDGPCEGAACAQCFKYACATCGRRSNCLLTCVACRRASAPARRSERA